jgi:hypothetical protein
MQWWRFMYASGRTEPSAKRFSPLRAVLMASIASSLSSAASPSHTSTRLATPYILAMIWICCDFSLSPGLIHIASIQSMRGSTGSRKRNNAA